MNDPFHLWKAKEFNETANTAWWDSLAPEFADRDIPTAENNFTMGIINKEGLVKHGDKALDIGCGGGGHSIALGDMGVNTLGIDVSPKMIEAAKKRSSGKSNVNFVLENWHSVNLEEKGYSKAFDFVLANMTPAIVDAESFSKISQASRGWCLMVKPFNRRNTLHDTLNKIAGGPEDKKTADDTILYAFSILWNSGLHPFFAYDYQEWHNKRPVNTAVDQYTKRIETFCTLDDGKRNAIRQHILSQAKDGFIEDITYTNIVGIYWKVN